MNKIQEVLAKIDTLNDQVKAAFDAADEDGGRALTADEKKSVIDSNKEIEALEHQAKDLMDEQALRSGAESRSRQLRQPAGGLGAGGYTGEGKDRKEAPRIVQPGNVVLDDPEFKAWIESKMNGGAFTSGQFGSSPRVAIPGGMKTLITGSSDTQAGALIPAQQMYPTMVQGTYARPLTIRDLVTTGTTTADAIEFPIEGVPTNNAAPVAEATATSGGSGAKPESALALSKGTTTIKTIAHWVPATRRALADAGMLRMYIDNFLRYGLDEELEDQMLTGDGAGENFLGILNTPNTQSQAFDTDVLTTTRKARTKVRVTGRATPTAYVMHPNNWETLDLLQDNEGRYYYGGPSILGTPRLWGLPVVESEGMTEGTSVVADWRRAVLMDREQTQILVSDSHSDFFVRNLIAILAELRAAFFCIRPAAFVEIDMTA
jgi:HK97 family phage major capsid protein